MTATAHAHATLDDLGTDGPANAVEALKAQLAAKDEAHARELADRESHFQTIQQDLEAAIAASATARDALRREIEALRAEIHKLSTRMAAAEDIAHDKSRAYDDLTAELNAAQRELEALRASKESDFLKWGDRTIPLDKARGALGNVLARAQGVLGKRRGE